MKLLDHQLGESFPTWANIDATLVEKDFLLKLRRNQNLKLLKWVESMEWTIGKVEAMNRRGPEFTRGVPMILWLRDRFYVFRKRPDKTYWRVAAMRLGEILEVEHYWGKSDAEGH